jgi:hypothetical protein
MNAHIHDTTSIPLQLPGEAAVSGTEDPQLWRWVATYRDGREVEQGRDRSETGEIIGFVDLDFNQLRVVELRPSLQRQDLPALLVLVDAARGILPVCFSRLTKTHDGLTMRLKSVERVWCLGTWRRVGGLDAWALMWASSNGVVTLTDGDDCVEVFGSLPTLPWIEERR